MMTEQASRVHPIALWLVVAGAGASGITGIGSMGQLNELNAAMEEQIRVAELRGQLQAEIKANRVLIDANRLALQGTMPNKGILRLHDSQQTLIEKLIDATGDYATKSELQLAIGKMRELAKGGEKQ